MKKETIPSLTDESWAKEDELGTIEKVLEYITPQGKQQVNAKAYIISGSEMEALSASLTKTDAKGISTFDSEKFERSHLKLAFRLNGTQLDNIYNHKSVELRNKMLELANDACGHNVDEKKIEEQKNSDGPVQSPGSLQ